MVTTLISPIISSICGGLFGGIQGCIERNQDSKKEIDLAKIQAEKEIAIASQQSIISQNQAGTQKDITEQEKSKTEASVRQSDVIEYQAFANAATQTSAIWNSQSMLANIANFIIATTRPNITYLLIGLCGYVGIKLITDNTINEDVRLTIFVAILDVLSTVMSYWFVRRSIEKQYLQEFQFQKKK